MKNYEKKIYIRDKRSPIPNDEKTSKIMSSIRAQNTHAELSLRKALWHSGARGYRLNWNDLPGKPDIVFLGKKIAIFVNGCFWHRCPSCQLSIPKSNSEFWKIKFSKNIERDKIKIKLLQDLNWKVLVLWECEIKSDVMKCSNKIIKVTKQ